MSVTAPETIENSLKSALLLELRKRLDVIVTETSSPDYRWKVVCIASAELLTCSSVGLAAIDLAEVEKYYPELAKYGMWWIKRYQAEQGGSVLYHGILAGSLSDIQRFAMRAGGVRSRYHRACA